MFSSFLVVVLLHFLYHKLLKLKLEPEWIEDKIEEETVQIRVPDTTSPYIMAEPSECYWDRNMDYTDDENE
jgi:hypothetical protein